MLNFLLLEHFTSKITDNHYDGSCSDIISETNMELAMSYNDYKDSFLCYNESIIESVILKNGCLNENVIKAVFDKIIAFFNKIIEALGKIINKVKHHNSTSNKVITATIKRPENEKTFTLSHEYVYSINPDVMRKNIKPVLNVIDEIFKYKFSTKNNLKFSYEEIKEIIDNTKEMDNKFFKNLNSAIDSSGKIDASKGDDQISEAFKLLTKDVYIGIGHGMTKATDRGTVYSKELPEKRITVDYQIVNAIRDNIKSNINLINELTDYYTKLVDKSTVLRDEVLNNSSVIKDKLNDESYRKKTRQLSEQYNIIMKEFNVSTKFINKCTSFIVNINNMNISIVSRYKEMNKSET